MDGNSPNIDSVSGAIAAQSAVQEDIKTDIYPPIGIEVESVSVFVRVKNFFVGAMTSMACGVANRPYSYFVKNNAPHKTQTVHITADLPPV